MQLDPAIANIILSVVANGLTSLLAAGSHGTTRALGFGSSHRGAMATPLAETLENAIDEFSDTFKWNGPPTVEVVCLFLRTPEVESMVRQVFAARLLSCPDKDITDIRRHFRASLAQYARLSDGQIGAAADGLWDALLDDCARALNVAIDRGILSAHEAKSGLRHRILLDEIHGLRKAIELLSGPGVPDITAILAFESLYRGQVGQRHGHITPQYVDTPRRYPIDDIFVAPRLRRANSKSHAAEVDLRSFLAKAYRAVILGHPGGGKSTLSAKVCHDLATRYHERIFAGRELTPILVVLRDYAAAKAARHCTIAQFIAATAASSYQVSPPPDAIDYLLLSGRAMVIFDGLDELVNMHQRREIASDVESFCVRYPAVPALVTSREVGYERAPLDPVIFAAYRLEPFNDAQVEDYATRWFARDESTPLEERAIRAHSFVHESMVVADLRSNPLMLDLMCNLYRRERYIPRNRPAVYEECALLLFDRWDRYRAIHVELPRGIESQIRPLLEYLAEWMFTDESAQAGATEARLVEKAADFLHRRRYEDREDARVAARAFIEFCRGRAWVFTDIGTTPDDDRLYYFTHRTFLEYFTALRLVSTADTQERLTDILLPHIEGREWDVVAQLAVQVKARHVADAGDTLLASLLASAQQSQGSEGWTTLSFAVRCLQFLAPSLSVIRSLAQAAMERCVARTADDLRAGTRVTNEEEAGDLSVVRMLRALEEVSVENRNAVMSAAEAMLTAALRSHDDNIVTAAYELCLVIGHSTLALLDFSSTSDSDALGEWRTWSNTILGAAPIDRIRAVAMHSLLICQDAYWRGRIDLRDYLAWHGVGALFRTTSYEVRGFDIRINCTAVDILTSVLSLTDATLAQGQAETRALSRLDDIGATIAVQPRPWLDVQDVAMLEPDMRQLQQPDDPWAQAGQQHLVAVRLAQPTRRFGLFALLATLSEIDSVTMLWLVDVIDATIGPVAALIQMRYQRGPLNEVDDRLVDELLDECGWSATQRALVRLWIHDDESFSAAREWPMDSDIVDERRFSNSGSTTRRHSRSRRRRRSKSRTQSLL